MTGVLDIGLFRRRKIRPIRQDEVGECGLASLAMVAGYHGMSVDLGTLRRTFKLSARGSSLRSLIAIADQMALTPRPVKLSLSEIANLHVPALLHWDAKHFVVLERVKGSKALIHDPGGPSRWFGANEISDSFTGVALELRPAEDFERGEHRERIRLAQLWRRITGLKRALLQTLVLSLVMQAFVLASPYYMQIAIDSALPALDNDLLLVLALGFGLLAAVNAIASLLRAFTLLSAGTSLSFGIAANIARRLFRLPVSWFERRHVGDILSRFGSVQPIQQALTQSAVAACLDGILALLILVLLFFYSAALAVVALVAFGLYALVRAISFSIQRDAQNEAIVAAAKEQSMMIETVRGIATLRLFNRETQRHALWQGRLTESLNATLNLGRIGVWQQTANTLIFGLETIVSIWLAVGFVIQGGFSVGMVFAYAAYKTQFIQRSSSLIDQAISFKLLGLHLERLSDIALAETDASFENPRAHKLEFGGRIELRNVGFRYSPLDPPILSGVNMVVEPGEHVAIVGPSGGGKSTLAKIILGLVEPDEGEVLVDDIPLNRFGHKNYHDQISAVLQDDCLFAGSLAENIALFDDAPDLQRILHCASVAAIHDDIERMPMRYETLVGDMGSSLSGGQKQRVLLARALYRNPKLLLMDEGTAHLDVRLEAEITAAMAGWNLTRVIIAHRPETIREASRILLVDKGDIHEIHIDRAEQNSLADVVAVQ